MPEPNDQNSLALVVRGNRRTAVAPPPINGSPLSDLLGDSIVQIQVGSSRPARTFSIHKKLLCQKVQFFDRMFNGAFQEGATQVGNLPEDHPVAFALFVGWLYKGVIEGPNADEGIYLNNRIQLFGFAEKYDIVELADMTMDHIVGHTKFAHQLLAWQQMSLAYKLTHENSKLRLFAARSASFAVLKHPSHSSNHAWCKANIQRAITENPDLGGDALETMRLQSGKPVADPRESPLCDYHQHSETETCPYENQ